jgi:predicted aspartyl protease
MNDYNRRLIHEISHHGVIIQVTLNSVGGRFAGLNANGLIDTGATDIVISTDLANRLGLRYIDSTQLQGVGGGFLDCDIYTGQIEVPELNFKKIVRLHAVKWKQDSHTILLGRAFLCHFMLNYDGPREMFHFTTPTDWQSETFESVDG